MPKFPHIEVVLIGQNGNAFFIVGRVMKAMKQAGVEQEDINSYKDEATSDDYNHLLRVTDKTVTIL